MKKVFPKTDNLATVFTTVKSINEVLKDKGLDKFRVSLTVTDAREGGHKLASGAKAPVEFGLSVFCKDTFVNTLFFSVSGVSRTLYTGSWTQQKDNNIAAYQYSTVEYAVKTNSKDLAVDLSKACDKFVKARNLANRDWVSLRNKYIGKIRDRYEKATAELEKIGYSFED